MLKLLFRLMLGLFLVIAVASSCVAATELTVELPSTSNETGDTIQLPVILKNDIDFAGFNIRVGNDIPGVTVTIDEERPVSGMMYTVNSKEDNEEQAIVGVITSPMSDSTIHLFTIDVHIDEDTVTSVPLEIKVREIISNKEGEINLDDLVQVNLSNINLGKTSAGNPIVASVKSEVQEIPAAVVPTFVATAVPTTIVLPASTNNPVESTVSGQTPSQSAVTSKQDSSPSADGAKTPGFGFIGVLGGILGVVAISQIKMRRR